MMDGNSGIFTKENLAIDPIERAFTIPSAWYTEERVFRFEKKYLFPSSWQYAGPSEILPDRGDQKPLRVSDIPFLLVRDESRKLRAFYNVCKHRGGPISTCQQNSKFLKCQYHGWTYRLDGSLRGVPHFRHAELFDRDAFGLTEIELQEWLGMLFLRGESGGPVFSELTHGITDQIKPRHPGDMTFMKRVTYEVKCNWKAYIDNYLEGYHIPHVHPELCDLLSFQDYKTEIFPWYSLQSSPFRPQESIYSSGEGKASYYFVFPNMMLNLLPGRLQVNLVEPLSVSSCRVIFDYYYADPDDQETSEKMYADIEYSDRVQKEDMEICEQVQLGLQSPAYDRGRFSVEMEQGVYHFQKLLKEFIRNSIPDSASVKVAGTPDIRTESPGK
jgi:choline monooxygenase